jgi:integrase
MAGYLRERDGRFYVRTRVKVIDPQTGAASWKQIEKAAGTSKRQAKAVLKDLATEVDSGRYVPTDTTVLELGRRWLREHVQANLKPGTAANYRGTFYTHIAPALGAVRLEDCTPQLVQAFLGRLRSGGMSRPTLTKVRRHLHGIFAFGQEVGLVTVNPATAPRKRGQHHRRQARGTALTASEASRFLRECSPRWRAFFTVALETGLRRGEMIGLQWGDVDLLERVLHVRRTIGAYDDPGEVSTTKTPAGERLVPILDGAQAVLEGIYAEAEDTSDGAPVFATVHLGAGRPLDPRLVSRTFRRYAERAGLPATIRLHDLRHTAITNAIAQGEDIDLIARFAGHAQTSTTVDVYGHLLPHRASEAARRMRPLLAEPEVLP